jgi:hypothetical protein
LKFGQVAVVVRVIPAVTAVHFRLAAPVETTQSRQSPQHQAANTQYVLVVLGHAINHIPVQPAWDAVHTFKDITYQTSV